jgi:hypothetical protein
MSVATAITSILARLLHTRRSNELQRRREFVSPAYAFRNMPPDLPVDETEREIALLLWDHPEVANRLGNPDLRPLSPEEKRAMLATVKDMLGIKPIRRRHLGYVGP